MTFPRIFVPASALRVIETLNITLDTDAGGWLNFTDRPVLEQGLFTNSGNALRFTFEAPATGTISVTVARVEHQGAGDAYDFAATPTQVTFDAGGSSFEISNGATKVSDTIPFSFDASQDLVLALHVENDAAKDDVRFATGLGGNYAHWWKSGGDDTATVDATGYTQSAGAILLLNKVEILA